MRLGKNCGNGEIFDLDSWFRYAPPMGGEKQWKDGRSAKELARFLTKDFPYVPERLESLLQYFTCSDAEFVWAGEHETSFARYGLGIGTGRNHDAILYNEDIFVGVEAKADEPFGDKYLGEEFEHASANKKKRIRGLIDMIFDDGIENHCDLRYQLLTACGGTLLEAYEKEVSKALLLIIVFKKDGCYTEVNDAENKKDLQAFLDATRAVTLSNGCYSVPTVFGQKHNINLYLKKMEVTV